MSTRSHVIITKGKKKAFVYRHYDGYPSGAGEDLKVFIKNSKDEINEMSVNDFAVELNKFDPSFYFENEGVHGDEEYIYKVDLDEHTLNCFKVPIRKNATEDTTGCDLEFEEKF